MNITLLGPEGAILLASLHRHCFAEGWTAEAMSTLLGTPGAAALVAMEGEHPAGFLLYRIAADEAEIITIGILPVRRERGLGGSLLGLGLRAMRRGGAAQCFLEVAEDNAAALALYTSAGFREVGRRPGYYKEAGRTVDALVLRRDLAPEISPP